MKGEKVVDKKLIYDSLMDCIDNQREMENKLEAIGLRFEYGDGAVGTFMEKNINKHNDCIIEVLGLHEKSYDKPAVICGTRMLVDLAIFYTEDEDVDWAITADDFFEVLYDAENKPFLRDLIFNTFVNKDVAAKEAINKHYGKDKVGVAQYLN